jgi:hypothetical protein
MNRAAEEAIKACESTLDEGIKEKSEPNPPVSSTIGAQPKSMKDRLLRPVNDDLSHCYITNTYIY